MCLRRNYRTILAGSVDRNSEETKSFWADVGSLSLSLRELNLGSRFGNLRLRSSDSSSPRKDDGKLDFLDVLGLKEACVKGRFCQ